MMNCGACGRLCGAGRVSFQSPALALNAECREGTKAFTWEGRPDCGSEPRYEDASKRTPKYMPAIATQMAR
jgi:hypothetical protein